MHKSGFARRFNEASFKKYVAAGVDDVTVTAALSAGGYVWARTGFEMKADAPERAKYLATRIGTALTTGSITQAEFDAIAPRLLVEGEEFDESRHLSSIVELAQMGIGERVLKGDSFSGIRLMHPASNWWAPNRPVDASAGVASLRDAKAVPDGVRQARNAVAALLPESLDPAAMSLRLERATALDDVRLARTSFTTTRIDVVGGEISGKVTMQAIDRNRESLGHASIRTRLGDDRLLASELTTNNLGTTGTPLFTDSVVAALRGAGVSRIKGVA